MNKTVNKIKKVNWYLNIKFWKKKNLKNFLSYCAFLRLVELHFVGWGSNPLTEDDLTQILRRGVLPVRLAEIET